MFMKELVEEYEEELRQEKLAAGIKCTLKSELYMPIPPPLSEETKRMRKENAERYAREERWMEAGRKAEEAAAEEAALEAARVAEAAAQYLP